MRNGRDLNGGPAEQVLIGQGSTSRCGGERTRRSPPRDAEREWGVMRCPSCDTSNPARAKFCLECGASLRRRCPSCGMAPPPQAKFCPACGAPLAGQVSLRAPAAGPLDARTDSGTPTTTRAGAPAAERRQLTVLFCDLVGSTSLSAALDPEELRELVRAYQRTCTRVIGTYGGHIAQYLGDGLLVYFGHPQAHEDDAQRAIRAALGILDALPRSSLRPLQVRIGIHTGLVVVGEMGGGGPGTRQETLALGETPNVAARLQALARPGTVVLSAATARLVEGYFVLQDAGAHALKGVAAPVQVWQVAGETGARGRLEAATRLTPLVGREQELSLLRTRWEQAREGSGQVVLLSGEPGIGKSRLIQVLQGEVVGEPDARVVALQCSPYHQQSAFYPLRDLLPAETAADPSSSPEQRRQRLLQALRVAILRPGERRPLLLTVEDVHLADPSTLELLDLLVDQVPATPTLAVCLTRPEYSPTWMGRPHVAKVTLTRLSQRQTTDLVGRVMRGRELPGEVLAQVVAKTDGVPLFVEELTRCIVETGLLRAVNHHYELMGPLPPLAIPATLQDSLMARLDRLATVKVVAQLGATIGREFTYELLEAVAPLDTATLQRDLAQLVESGLLHAQGLPPQATYTFKHALIQEAAYESLLRSTRRLYHQRIAQELSRRWPATAAAQPELLAHHFTEAGLLAEAVPHWLQAGQLAIQRSANPEAISHLTRALAAVTALPDTPERARRELALQVMLGVPLLAARGYAAPETAAAYARARELCQQVEAPSELSLALRGLWAFHNHRADFRTARELGQQLLALGERLNDTALLLEAHRALGITLFSCGELGAAQERLECGIALYDPLQHRGHAFLYGQDPLVALLSQSAWLLCLLGYPDGALTRTHRALAVAREIAHPVSLAGAHFCAATVHELRREAGAALEHAQAVIGVSAEHGLPFFLAQGTILRGWALAHQGQVEEGMAQMRQGLAGYGATGAQCVRPHYLALLAEAHGIRGEPAEGLRILAEAQVALDTSGERRWESQVHRLQGELLLLRSPATGSPAATAAAEARFRQALETARQQEAKSLELQAATGLSRLLQRQGRRGEARQALAEVYGWFREGFATADLQAARALQEEL